MLPGQGQDLLLEPQTRVPGQHGLALRALDLVIPRTDHVERRTGPNQVRLRTGRDGNVNVEMQTDRITQGPGPTRVPAVVHGEPLRGQRPLVSEAAQLLGLEPEGLGQSEVV